mmetsp:Transcript_35658/g.60078  ORF Transcript_35658/g.60078 Transcript_35658/m.60078 type:complete len:455 (-) Transcript_35658:310-1674(-)
MHGRGFLAHRPAELLGEPLPGARLFGLEERPHQPQRQQRYRRAHEQDDAPIPAGPADRLEALLAVQSLDGVLVDALLAHAARVASPAHAHELRLSHVARLQFSQAVMRRGGSIQRVGPRRKDARGEHTLGFAATERGLVALVQRILSPVGPPVPVKADDAVALAPRPLRAILALLFRTPRAVPLRVEPRLTEAIHAIVAHSDRPLVHTRQALRGATERRHRPVAARQTRVHRRGPGGGVRPGGAHLAHARTLLVLVVPCRALLAIRGGCGEVSGCAHAGQHGCRARRQRAPRRVAHLADRISGRLVLADRACHAQGGRSALPRGGRVHKTRLANAFATRVARHQVRHGIAHHLHEGVVQWAALQLTVLRVHPRAPRVRNERILQQLLRQPQPQEHAVGAVGGHRLHCRREERSVAHHRGHLQADHLGVALVGIHAEHVHHQIIHLVDHLLVIGV